MIVSLNGFVLNDPTNPNNIYLDEPINGLSMAPIRTSQGNYSGRDGGWVGAQFYGPRLISMTGKIFSSSTATIESTRAAFEAAVSTGIITLAITTNAGGSYSVTTYLDALDIPIQRSPSQAPFQLTLIAPDPTIYDNSAGGTSSVAISPILGGGVTWPITWPITWAPSTLPTTITNTGNVLIYPKITLNNVMTNPIIQNNTTGQFIKFNGFTTSAGAVLVIDMLNRTVLLNGGSVLSFVDVSSQWWGLSPGSNAIQLTTGSGSDTVTGTVSWRAGYRGI
jgi:hypothetical protein